jgi:hypothetical protein
MPTEPDQPLDLSLEAGAAGPLTATDAPVFSTPLKTPDFSPVQIVSGIPIIAELLHTFGVFDLSSAQQESLEKTVTWAFALLGADALIRVGRAIGKRF